jgi:hypothetical protein
MPAAEGKKAPVCRENLFAYHLYGYGIMPPLLQHLQVMIAGIFFQKEKTRGLFGIAPSGLPSWEERGHPHPTGDDLVTWQNQILTGILSPS